MTKAEKWEKGPKEKEIWENTFLKNIFEKLSFIRYLINFSCGPVPFIQVIIKLTLVKLVTKFSN